MMLFNYFKIALRSLRKNKLFTGINILGLSVGIATCIMILLFVNDELSYDKYHDKADRIYRVSRYWTNQSGDISLHLGHVAPPFGPLLKTDFDGTVIESARFLQASSPLVNHKDDYFTENNLFFADEGAFRVFSWKILEGNAETALTEPNSIVLTQKMADKYFPNESALGKVLGYSSFSRSRDFKVTGVMEDVPANSHFHPEFLASFKTLEDAVGIENMMSNFGNNSYSTFVVLPEGYAPHLLEAQFPEFIDRHMTPADGSFKPSESTFLKLWPLSSIHLYSNLDSEIEQNSDIKYIYIYTSIALFILLIACINFMNLSTARYSEREKEVGLRKVMGADRRVLIRQFLGESIFMASIALLVSLFLIEFSLPYFNDFLEKSIEFTLLDWKVLALLASLVLGVGLLAGSYPAFFLSSFQPAVVLKGGYKIKGLHLNLRSVLVVMQFAISIGLIISMGVVRNQLAYMKTKDLGFDKDNVALLPVSPKIISEYSSIREQLLQNPGIADVSMVSRAPSGRLLDSQGWTAEIGSEMVQGNFRIADIHVDFDFLKTFDIKLSAGRDFNFEQASDSLESFIVNESAIKAMGYTSVEESIGKKFNYGGRTGYLIGVVKDFHFETMHQPIAPMVFMISNGYFSQLAVKLRPETKEQTMAFLQEKWSFLRPNYPFAPSFVDDSFSQQYQSEDRLGKVFGFFSLLAMIIATLGLFGLASFMVQKKIKEIGIRKVLGASVPQIVVLLSKNFTFLVLISFAISGPIAWYAMNRWLDSFAYHDTIGYGIFALAIFIALLIALVTVSYETIKAAMANPVDSLKSE